MILLPLLIIRYLSQIVKSQIIQTNGATICPYCRHLVKTSSPSETAEDVTQIADTTVEPPLCEQKLKILNYAHQVMKDPYYWLREKENPDVLTYLKSENAYTKLMLSVTEFLQETLYKEFISRIKGDDTSAPIKKGKSNKETREIKRDSSCDSFLN
jgi:hypothetical protein